MKNKLLCVSDLSYGYDKNLVLKDINFDVYDNDYIGIIGPNGSGKSTLAKIILNVYKAFKGEIILSDKVICKDEIAYVPQQVYSNYKNFPASVFEIVRMGLLVNKKFLKFYSKNDNKLVEEILEKLNLSELSNKQITNLSGGQRQRVLLARALVSKPKLLILDEPTSALDPEVRDEFYKLLETINAEGTTLMLISHDLNTIKNYVNKILYLDKQLVYYGDSEEFTSSKEYLKYNEMESTHEHNH